MFIDLEMRMAGDKSYKPGEIVKVSGIYAVVHDDGKDTFEMTCVEGKHFPPTRSGKNAHFGVTLILMLKPG
ncbi:hypothetical protein CBA19CS22_39075 [Caballeronia novacaledonica]|uniref:Uncharacterized protein n=1 Tax=Caballeronia novacaledonica TaxID=1544861 RepID=A0ACB5R5Q1_9BURK|nr:hypothetical protein CBA19CS22_39075 [Caballeronia novacaledonica]